MVEVIEQRNERLRVAFYALVYRQGCMKRGNSRRQLGIESSGKRSAVLQYRTVLQGG